MMGTIGDFKHVSQLGPHFRAAGDDETVRFARGLFGQLVRTFGRLSPKVTVWGRDGTPEDVVGHYVAQLLKGLVNERRIFVAAD